MQVKFENNTLTVITNLDAASIEKKDAILTDDKKNELFRIAMSRNNQASIGEYGISCNATVDGKAAAVIIMDRDKTVEEVKDFYGLSLVKAADYEQQLVAQVEQQTAAVNELFGA